MKTKLEIKAEKLLRIDTRRKAHNAALSTLNTAPLKKGEDHETRGLKMWRKLRRIESAAHDAATAQCNGERYGSQPYREDPEELPDGACGEWDNFCDYVRAEVVKVFGGIVPAGFHFNQDPRGYALKLDSDKATIPQGMETDWGGYGLLAAEIND